MLPESAPATFCQDDIVMLTYTHNHAENSESFYNYDANLTSVITIELKFIFWRCWFLCMTTLAMPSSMLKTSLKFWGTSFKFWIHPWNLELISKVKPVSQHSINKWYVVAKETCRENTKAREECPWRNSGKHWNSSSKGSCFHCETSAEYLYQKIPKKAKSCTYPTS